MSFAREARQLVRRAAGTAVAVLGLIASLAHCGKAQDRARYASDSPRAMPIAVGDFDGDDRPDLATVQMGQASLSHARYWIHLQFSTGLKQSIGVTAPVGGLQIASRDVNGDNRLDLVVSTAWRNEPVAVLLNEGNGNFSIHDSSAFPASVWAAEASMSSPDARVQDASVVLPRCSSGDCGQKQASLFPHVVAERHIYDALSGQPSYLVIRHLGRAPPSPSFFA